MTPEERETALEAGRKKYDSLPGPKNRDQRLDHAIIEALNAVLESKKTHEVVGQMSLPYEGNHNIHDVKKF